jgi:hypothetical protein
LLKALNVAQCLKARETLPGTLRERFQALNPAHEALNVLPMALNLAHEALNVLPPWH